MRRDEISEMDRLKRKDGCRTLRDGHMEGQQRKKESKKRETKCRFQNEEMWKGMANGGKCYQMGVI